MGNCKSEGKIGRGAESVCSLKLDSATVIVS